LTFATRNFKALHFLLCKDEKKWRSVGVGFIEQCCPLHLSADESKVHSSLR
jgi:hypothetical protein